MALAWACAGAGAVAVAVAGAAGAPGTASATAEATGAAAAGFRAGVARLAGPRRRRKLFCRAATRLPLLGIAHLLALRSGYGIVSAALILLLWDPIPRDRTVPESMIPAWARGTVGYRLCLCQFLVAPAQTGVGLAIPRCPTRPACRRRPGCGSCAAIGAGR